MSATIHSKVKALMKNKNYSDKEFFTSKAFASHLCDLARAITKRYKSSVKIRVYIFYDINNPTIAFTDNELICINAGCSLARGVNRTESYKRILGLFAHELAHLLWTDFLISQSGSQSINKYNWLGKPVDSELEINNIEFWDLAKSYEAALELLIKYIGEIQNIIEDGYIENRLQYRYPGTLSVGLRTVRQYHWDSFEMLDEMIAKEQTGEMNPLFTILNILLQYTKYGEIKGLDNVPDDDEHIEYLKMLIPVVDEALCSNPYNRFVCSEKICLIIFPVLKDYIKECLDKKQQQNPNQSTSQLLQQIAQELNNSAKQNLPGNSQQGTGNTSGIANDGEDEQGQYKASQNKRNKTKQKLNMPNVNKPKSNSTEQTDSGENSGQSEEAQSSKQTDSEETDKSTVNNSTDSGKEEQNKSNNNSSGSSSSESDTEDEGDESSSGSGSNTEDDDTETSSGSGSDAEDESTESSSVTESDTEDDGNESSSGSESDTEGEENFGSDGDDTEGLLSRGLTTGGVGKTNNGINSKRLAESEGEAEETDGDGEEETVENDASFDEAIRNCIETLLNTKAEADAEAEAEAERVRELNSFADNLDLKGVHRNCHIRVNRTVEVPDFLIERYDEISPPLIAIAKRLAKGYMQIADDARTGGRLNGLLMGRHFDAGNAYRNDGKVFVKNIMPQDMQPLAVGLLIDESGSMSGSRCAAAMSTAIVIEAFCSLLNIPLCIYGHTGDYDVEMFSYCEFEKFSKNDKYRLMDISARSCNRDGAAIRYVAEKLLKRDEEAKLLILISDGQPNGGNYGGQVAEADLQEIQKEYTKKGICFCAAAIGEDKPVINRIYGDAFLDVSDLNQLPKKLIKVLDRYLHTA